MSALLGRVRKLRSLTEPGARHAMAALWADHQLWPHLDLLIAAMLDKLTERARPSESRQHPGWRLDDPADLIAHLREEVEELEAAIHSNAPVDDVWREAADVANMAAMVADNASLQRHRRRHG